MDLVGQPSRSNDGDAYFFFPDKLLGHIYFLPAFYIGDIGNRKMEQEIYFCDPTQTHSYAKRDFA
ncbi:hypothetical protein KSZ_00220 [Dictyobacter formicarum]|uniref:Uncharacterized protein n=1 Tax=Dictyobacter formicarum TaxID=2778368 RepID=A0ABQ3V931_9CHLR|nr:hypothetical protein KSZ_00220 [Dictyobacter formicarum]